MPVRSRRFCYCIPARVGVIIFSFLCTLASAGLGVVITVHAVANSTSTWLNPLGLLRVRATDAELVSTELIEQDTGVSKIAIILCICASFMLSLISILGYHYHFFRHCIAT